jgi:nucleoside-diphosphate-sugar epimerase
MNQLAAQMDKVLVTGANGFVGRALCAELAKRGFDVRGAIRSLPSRAVQPVETFVVGDVGADTDWTAALDGVGTIIHLAARAHILRDTAIDPLAEFCRVNLAGTVCIARHAVAAGVRRLIYISSIGVNGAETFDKPFTADDAVQPHSAYAISKHRAELALRKIADEGALDVVIIRPPLVYGAAAPGNFGQLVRYLLRGVPLPLGAVRNRRSFVALDNFVDLIAVCLVHPMAANGLFLVSDGDDLSTPQLLRRLGHALHRPARLLPVPATLLKLAAAAIGKQELAQRLCGSLQVDIVKTREILNWSPPLTVDDALARTANWYLIQNRDD